MLKIEAAKRMFFDSAAVMKAADAGTRKVLSKFGAFVRTRSRTSIRKRKKASQPGQPPSSHTGLLKKFIFFGYDAAKKSVVIGPTLANMVSFDESMRPTRGTIPENLEYGGTSFILEEWNGKRWIRRDLRRKGAVSDVGALRDSDKTNVFNKRPIRKRKVTISARPFMQPAFEKEKTTLPALWANSIRK